MKRKIIVLQADEKMNEIVKKRLKNNKHIKKINFLTDPEEVLRILPKNSKTIIISTSVLSNNQHAVTMAKKVKKVSQKNMVILISHKPSESEYVDCCIKLDTLSIFKNLDSVISRLNGRTTISSLARQLPDIILTKK